MLLVISFVLPLLAALLCIALNRVVPTRWVGVLGALALAGAAGVLLGAARQNALQLPEYVWATFDENPVRLALHFDGLSLPLALFVLGGGALALLSLALSLPARLRGFGGLFAALLLLLLTTLVGLAVSEPLLVAFTLALTALLSFVALRSSGIQFAATSLPAGLLAGLLAALALLGTALVQRGVVAGTPPTPLLLLCWTLAALLLLGLPPFHAVTDETTEAPAGLAGALLTLGLPLLGGVALLRFIAAQIEDTSRWHTVLLVLGVVSALISAAGALQERRLRRLFSWQLSAQLGLFLAALGLPQSSLTVAAPILLLNAMLTTLAAYLAIVLLERHAGTDDLTQITRNDALPLTGLALLVTAASAVGLPGTLGYWGRSWLFDGLRATHPWAIAPMLGASALLALAFVAPLMTFWRAQPLGDQPARSGSATLIQISALLVMLPLIVFGVVPAVAWQLIGANAQTDLTPGAVAVPPALPDSAMQIASAGVVLLVVLVPLLLRRSARRIAIDSEVHSMTMAPDAFAESVRWLAWLGAPAVLFGAVWTGLQTGSRLIRRSLALFEQRYYLAGLMLAVVAVVLLML